MLVLLNFFAHLYSKKVYLLSGAILDWSAISPQDKLQMESFNYLMIHSSWHLIPWIKFKSFEDTINVCDFNGLRFN